MSNFDQLAIKQIQILADLLADNSDLDDLEIDLINEVLYIALPDGRQYVINKHGPSKQIWVSSPLSGAGYFTLDENKNIWRNNQGQELVKLICTELGVK